LFYSNLSIDTGAWRAPSRGRRLHTFKTNEAAGVEGEVRHADFASRADDADGAHDLRSRAVLLIAEYMLNAGAPLRTRFVAAF
jgi:hypothetical protein